MRRKVVTLVQALYSLGPYLNLKLSHVLLGVRIILLFCLAPHAKIILQEASKSGMTSAGWAWLVSEGITNLVSLIKP